MMDKRKIAILLSGFILSLIAISFYGGPVTYIFFFTVLMIPVISFIYIFLVIASLKIYQETEGRDMVSGEPYELYITLQNEGWFSFSSLKIRMYSSFSSVTEIDEAAEYELPPHSFIKRRSKLVCRYRGEYNVGIKEIRVGDFFGLFSVIFRIKEPLNVIVSPAIIHPGDDPDALQIFETERDSMAMRTEADIPVREYVMGDDLRFINWKISGRLQKIMIREKKGEEKSGVAIIMDCGRYYKNDRDFLPKENGVMEDAISLSLYFLEKMIPADLFIFEDQVIKLPVNDREDFEELYRRMCTLKFREDRDIESFILALEKESVLSGYRIMIFVLEKWSDETGERIKSANRDNTPLLFRIREGAE